MESNIVSILSLSSWMDSGFGDLWIWSRAYSHNQKSFIAKSRLRDGQFRGQPPPILKIFVQQCSCSKTEMSRSAVLLINQCPLSPKEWDNSKLKKITIFFTSYCPINDLMHTVIVKSNNHCPKTNWRRFEKNGYVSVPISKTKLSFHALQKDECVWRLWLRSISRENFTSTKNTRVCSQHNYFVSERRDENPYRQRGHMHRRVLKEGVIQSIFPNYPEIVKRPRQRGHSGASFLSHRLETENTRIEQDIEALEESDIFHELHSLVFIFNELNDLSSLLSSLPYIQHG